MSLSFSEAKLEQAIIELLQDQGYQHLIGDNVPRSSLDQVIIEDDLRHYLAARYQPDGITEEEIQRLIYPWLVKSLLLKVVQHQVQPMKIFGLMELFTGLHQKI